MKSIKHRMKGGDSMEDKNYPTFQWSRFVNSEDQFVVRGEDFKKWVEDVRKVVDEFKIIASVNVTKGEDLEIEEPLEDRDDVGGEEESFCKIHKVQMKERDGKYGKFYSHYVGKYPNGTYCSGTPKNE